MQLIKYCANAINQVNPEFALASFCDLFKAFDVINHDMYKLKSYGIFGMVNQWFPSYLSDRGRLCDLAVACWTTNDYHPCSNLGVGISEGCFIFDSASLPLEVTI